MIHLYCTVVDNFGDIGVCWRLARQLANEHARAVTLWVDDWRSARQLVPALPERAATTTIAGVQIRPWFETNQTDDCTGDVLVEAFACTPPAVTRAQLTARQHKPVYLNLEYLSAEAWTESLHLSSGFVSAYGARRHFFFPGPRAGAGGLLREAGLLVQRNAWQADDAVCSAFLAQHDLHAGEAVQRHVCFGYVDAPHAAQLDALQAAGRPALLAACGKQTQQALATLALPPIIRSVDVPFVSQDDFDRLLWSADVCWVRGEDSLIRALWSGRPYVWQIYKQAEDAHVAKLKAWLDVYCEGFPASLRQALCDVWLAWNGVAGAPVLPAAWLRLMAQEPSWRVEAQRRSREMAEKPALSTQFLGFIDELRGKSV